MSLSRRHFLAVTVAAVCVGCSDDGDGDGGEVVVDDDDGQARPGADGSAFGEPIPAGTVDEVEEAIAGGGGAMFVAAARAWIVPGVGDEAFLALYQKCTHLGCRVPWCASSKRFECQCHLAIFNRIGEYVEGPAPRGLDRFPIVLDDDGQVVVDTSRIFPGPDPDVLTVDGEPAGAVCAAAPQ